jgi:AhpD family alkylhydroperoxidase
VQPRIVPQSRLYELVPSLREGLIGIGKAVERSGLDRKLIELAKIRASQINGCAFCLDMHAKDAIALGESETRLLLLPAWREASCYSDRERAALELTEAVTRLAAAGVPDEVWERAAKLFPPEELAGVLWAATAINAWNRIAITTRMEPGHYTPGQDE